MSLEVARQRFAAADPGEGALDNPALGHHLEALWLSITAADGLASRPACSRTATDAHEALRSVHDWFNEGFDTPEEAKTLLDGLA